MRYSIFSPTFRQPRFPYDPFGLREFYYQEEERQRITASVMEIIKKLLRPIEAWVEREAQVFQWSMEYTVQLPTPAS